MRRRVPTPPRLSILSRRLARLPAGGPTGAACAAAGFACIVGIVFVRPAVFFPELHDEHQGHASAGSGLTGTSVTPPPSPATTAHGGEGEAVSGASGSGPSRSPFVRHASVTPGRTAGPEATPASPSTEERSTGGGRKGGDDHATGHGRGGWHSAPRDGGSGHDADDHGDGDHGDGVTEPSDPGPSPDAGSDDR